MAARSERRNLWPVVFDADGQPKGEHADVMHGPYTESHCEGAASQPNKADKAFCGRDASAEIERGVCGQDCDDDR